MVAARWLSSRIVRTMLLGLLAALTLLSCSYMVGSAQPTPADEVADVIAQLVVRGVTVQGLTSGEAGCPGSALHSNGVHFQATLSGQATAADVYLLRWKSSDAFTADATEFDACVAEYEAAHPLSTVDQFALDPWRAYGPGWSPQLRSTLEDALRAAAAG
jgi:hypothetical protein